MYIIFRDKVSFLDIPFKCRPKLANVTTTNNTLVSFLSALKKIIIKDYIVIAWLTKQRSESVFTVILSRGLEVTF